PLLSRSPLRSQRAMSLVPQWIRRSLGPSRSAVLAHLRGEPRTVEQLAGALRLTPSAVRAHLAVLEQAGLIDRVPVRRAARGKPAFAYRLTKNAMVMLSSAYAPAASHLAVAVLERLDSHEAIAIFRAAGRSLAIRHRSGAARLRHRVDDAAEAL